jgi:hypothetical protein
MTKRHRSERSEESTVLRFVPVCGKAIRDPYKQSIPLDFQSLRGLEPSSDNLLGKLSPSLVEKSSPDIGRG